MQAFKFFLAPVNNEVILEAIESTIEIDEKAEKPINDLIDIAPISCQIRIFARVNMFYKTPIGNLHIETGVKLPALQEIEVVFPFAKTASMTVPFRHKVDSFQDKDLYYDFPYGYDLAWQAEQPAKKDLLVWLKQSKREF